MAEATFHGKSLEAHWKPSGGAFSAIASVVEWVMSLTADVGDSSVAHATEVGKQSLIGQKTGTATITCHLPGDRAIQEGDVGDLELLRTANNGDGGYASNGSNGVICTEVAPGIDKDGVEAITYSFQFRGAISATVTQGV